MGEIHTRTTHTHTHTFTTAVHVLEPYYYVRVRFAKSMEKTEKRKVPSWLALLVVPDI